MERISNLDIKLIKDNNGVFTFSGKLPGSVTTILSGVHGDEIFGPISVLNILKNIKIVAGKVHFIIGNIKGIELGQRFLERDMNRLFIEPFNDNSYEGNRVKEILPFILESDYLLDIHNTFGTNSIPFLISENEKGIFNIEHVVSGFEKLHPGSSDNFMNNGISEGYCLEIGSGIGSVSLGEESIYKFLSYTNNLDLGYSPTSNIGRRNYVFNNLYRTKTDKFKLAKKFKDFDKVKKGQLIGYDGSEEVKALYDGVIIFAYQPLNKSRIAFCLGKHKS